MKMYITHIEIFTENEIIPNGSILIENGMISEIHDSPKPIRNATVIDGNNLKAVPGYIDSHCHGGGGFDCNEGTVESILGMRAFYEKHGVTSLYPTLAANLMPQTVQGLEAIREAMKQNEPGHAEVPGCHMEGPFLNKVYKGSQSEKSIIPIKPEHLELLEAHKDLVRRITIAPEVEDNASYFPLIKQMGIHISIGHSCSEYQEIAEVVQKGAGSVTHLYNAMSQTKKVGPFRVGGVLEAGLTMDDLYTEIIADGYHVPTELIQIAYRCKGADKISVCSDANQAAGGAHGDVIHSCGEVFVIEQGVSMNSNRTSLASSITPLDQMVRFLIFEAKIPAWDVIKMVSTTTARMLGIDNRKGSIAIGKDADMNIVDKGFNVVKTFCKGILVLS